MILLLLLSCMSMLGGCAMRGPLSWEPEAEPKPYTYHLSKWSRTGVSYQDIQSQIFLRSTLLSPAFASVLAEEKAQRMGFGITQTAQTVEAAVNGAREELTFFIALVTRDPYWNDLEEANASLVVRLQSDEGNQAAIPKVIKRLDENELSDYRPFFPYANRLTTGYLVKFSMPKRLDRLRLRVSGPPGFAEVEWQIKK